MTSESSGWTPRGWFALLMALVSCTLASAELNQPLEDWAIVEEDWRKQDGIGTERAPVSYAAAIALTFERGDLLISDLSRAGVPLTPTHPSLAGIASGVSGVVEGGPPG